MYFRKQQFSIQFDLNIQINDDKSNICISFEYTKLIYKGTVKFMAEYERALNIKIINKSEEAQIQEAQRFRKNILFKVLSSKLKCSLSTKLNKC